MIPLNKRNTRKEILFSDYRIFDRLNALNLLCLECDLPIICISTYALRREEMTNQKDIQRLLTVKTTELLLSCRKKF